MRCQLVVFATTLELSLNAGSDAGAAVSQEGKQQEGGKESLE